MLWIAVGAVLLGVFGCVTAAKGAAAARGRGDSWLGLAIGAPFLHWLWFLCRTIGNGVLDRTAQIAAQRNNGLRFGTIRVGYLAMWIVMRYSNGSGRPADSRLPQTAASR